MKNRVIYSKASNIFSSWYKCFFKDELNNYTSLEQYISYKKAILFNDLETASKILKTSNQGKIKDLVRYIDNELLNNNIEQIIYEGNYLKFSQNEILLNELLKFKNYEFCCAILDYKYGCGVDEILLNEGFKYSGENLHGKSLNKLLLILNVINSIKAISQISKNYYYNMQPYVFITPKYNC